MGTLWKIALCNTIRHGRRTIITAVVQMVGIAVYIFFNSMLAGMDRMAIDNMTDYTLSSMKIRTPAYVDDLEATPLDKGLPHPRQVLAAAAQGLAAAPRLRFVARLSNYTDEIPVIADAVDPRADARELLGAPGGPDGLVTEVDVALARAPSLAVALAEGDAAAARLRAALPDERVDPISQLASGYLNVRNSKSRSSVIIVLIVLIVLVISAVGIVNTILMSVYSRVREIGVLRAYGMTPLDILRLFTLEGLALGLVGSLLGVGLGALANFFLIAHGMDMSAYAEGFGSLPVGGLLRGEWDVKTMVSGFVFGVIVFLVAARIPAGRAARLEPTSALRFQ